MEELGFVPRIYKKEIPTDNKAVLYWEFDKKGNELISGFELRRSNTDQGPYETVKKGIQNTDRQTNFDGLQRPNHFTIVTMGLGGRESESFTTLVQKAYSITTDPPV